MAGDGEVKPQEWEGKGSGAAGDATPGDYPSHSPAGLPHSPPAAGSTASNAWRLARASLDEARGWHREQMGDGKQGQGQRASSAFERVPMREMRTAPSPEETRNNPRCRSAVLYHARVRDPSVATAISRRGALRRLHQRADVSVEARVLAPIESVRHEADSLRRNIVYRQGDDCGRGWGGDGDPEGVKGGR